MGKKGKKGGGKDAQQPPADAGGKPAPANVQQKQSAVDPKPGPSGDPGITAELQVKKQHQVQPARSETSTPSSDSSQTHRAWGSGGVQQQKKIEEKQAPGGWGKSGRQQQQEQQQQQQQQGGQQKQRGQQQQQPGQQKQQGQEKGKAPQQQQKQGQQQQGGPPHSGRGPPGTQQPQQQKGQPPPGWGPSGTQQPQQQRGQTPPGWGPSGTQQPHQQRVQPPPGWGPTGTQQPQQQIGQPPPGWGASGTQQPQQQRGQTPPGWGPSGTQQPHQQRVQPPSGWGPTGTQQPQQQIGHPPPGWGASGTQQPQQQRGQTPPGWGPSGTQQPQQQIGQPSPGWGASGTQQPQQQKGQPPPGWGASGSQQPQKKKGGQPPPVKGASGSRPQQEREQIKATVPEDDFEKDMQKLAVSQPEKSPRQPGAQSAGTKAETKSLVIRSIEREYNIGSTKSGPLIKWCGTAGAKHKIEANYLKLNLDKIPDIAYQYDVKFNIERPTRFRPEAFEQFRRTVLNQGRGPVGFPIAFDTMNIAFSAERVPASLLNVSHPVVCIDSATGVEKKVEITINEAGTVELNLLKNYSQTGITDRHIRAVQCVDVVLRTAPAQISKQIGRAFYRRPDNPPDLGDGFDLWLGLFQALVLGDVPMLNVDIAHKGFPKSDNLLQIYEKYGYDAENFIKNLNIIYNPPRIWNGTSKLYKANGFVKPANQETFVNENQETITVAAYYQSKNYPLKRPDVPCVSVGTVRKICFPLELCHVQEGQDVKKKAGPNQVRALIKHAATATYVRKQKIMQLFNDINYNKAELLRGFNVSVGEKFIELMARIIRPPKIKYANGSLEPQRGSWRADRFTYLKPATITKWAILVTANRINDGAVGNFANMIKKEAAKHNMGFDDYVKWNETNVRNLPKIFEKFKSEGRSIVFVIISGFGDSYSKVKQFAEINYGLLTQCVKANTVERKMDPSTIANIFLKVNSKLNGINHMLEPSNAIPMMSNTNEAVMFLGADVTHPSPDQTLIPSVVGVAGSYDPYAFQYKFSWRLQDPRAEMIGDMENIMIDQLRNFEQRRGKLPTHIIYYRDGVSNGQFKELERVELNAINRACAKFPKYKPRVTCLVVQKRHHTRFFPVSPGSFHDRDRNKNVLPGTVVDTTITHPGEKQFFLVSHESIQGTAKPSKYCIIRDDSNFTADELQAMTYSLCHLFTRCNRAVSYPAPAYYAHHVAARGRVYIEGARINLMNLAREYASRNVDAIIRSNPLFFV